MCVVFLSRFVYLVYVDNVLCIVCVLGVACVVYVCIVIVLCVVSV